MRRNLASSESDVVATRWNNTWRLQMSDRPLALLRTAVGALTVITLAGAPAATQTVDTANKTYKAPRTPDGQPDLQGIWNNTVSTPLERPAAFAGKERLTPEGL